MALSGPACDTATYATITCHSFGNSTYITPIFPIATLDSMIAEVSATIGPIISIDILGPANGEILDCCPDGYTYDESVLACVPVVNNPPPTPPPTSPAPPNNGDCPPGWTLDPSGWCTPTGIGLPGQPSPPSVFPIGGPPPPNPPPIKLPLPPPPACDVTPTTVAPLADTSSTTSDEIGDLQINLTAALATVQSAGSSTTDPCCCADLIVTAITGTNQMLQAIAAIMGTWILDPATGATAVDLTTINTELTALAATLAQLVANQATQAVDLQAAVDSVATAIAAIPAPDLSELASIDSDLKALNPDLTTQAAQVASLQEYIAQNGVVPADLAQVLGW